MMETCAAARKKSNKINENDIKPYHLAKFISADLLRSEWEDYFDALFDSAISFEEFVEQCNDLKVLHQLQNKLVVLTRLGSYDEAIEK